MRIEVWYHADQAGHGKQKPVRECTHTDVGALVRSYRLGRCFRFAHCPPTHAELSIVYTEVCLPIEFLLYPLHRLSLQQHTGRFRWYNHSHCIATGRPWHTARTQRECRLVI